MAERLILESTFLIDLERAARTAGAGRASTFLRAHARAGPCVGLVTAGEIACTNDLWIAAVAVAHGLPLVTRNERHFRRMAGLHVLGY